MKQNDFTSADEELNPNNNQPSTQEEAGKPLKKLVRTPKCHNGGQEVNPNSNPVTMQHDEQENINAEQMPYQLAEEPEYHGRYEAENSSQENEYHGRYENNSQDNENCNDEYSDDSQYDEDSQNEQTFEQNNDNIYYDESPESIIPTEKKKISVKNVLTKTGTIIVSLAVIVLLVLNMPIIAYNKSGQPLENVSIITFFKRWQPLVSGEGELQENSMNLNVNSEIVHEDFSDGLDLPQSIEGQYTVLFLGFDESSNNSDVNWIFQFDIAAAKLNILQVPRDTCMPYYTSSYTSKFNSIYGSGDESLTPIQRVVNAVQDNFGIPIDAYVTTNCYDIVSMVDLVGGIPITLDEEIVYEADKIIPAGSSTLSGKQAEWFVRYRHGFAEGDIGRVKNQRKFLAAAMEKMLNIMKDDGKAKFYSYLKEIYDNQYILTDLSVENMSMIADFASTISMDNVCVNMVPGEGAWYYPDGHSKQSVWSVHKQATIDMLNEYYRPYQNDLTPEESALTELVTDYLNTSNDNTMDTLEELQNGEQPGQSNTEAATDNNE